MTILTDLLPFLKGWKYHFQPPVAFTIPAGGWNETYNSKTNYDEPIDGYILGVSGVCNQPTTTLQILHVGPSKQERSVTGSPFALNAGGLQYPNGSGFWYGVYNAVLGIYSAYYTPDSRLGSFNDYMRIRVLAPAGVATTVSSYHHSIVEVYDRKAWLNSWRKMFQSDVFKVRMPKEA